jgi:rhodanese-related sulfurtransferase
VRVVEAVALHRVARFLEQVLQLVRVCVPPLAALQSTPEERILELRRHVDQQEPSSRSKPTLEVCQQASAVLHMVNRLLHQDLVELNRLARKCHGVLLYGPDPGLRRDPPQHLFERIDTDHIALERDLLEDDFDREKKIVVYGASPDCSASQEAAETLTRNGFQHVYDYEGGMSDWREAGNPVEGATA